MAPSSAEGRYLRALRPVTVVLAAGLVVIVASGCGSSRPTARSVGQTTKTATSSSATSHTSSLSALSAERYRAIAAMFRAGLPLDYGNEPAWRRTERSVCQRLDQRDPLIRAFRSQCLIAADTYYLGAAAQACPARYASASNPLAGDKRIALCQARAYSTWAIASELYFDGSEALNRAVDRYVRNGPCRNTLRNTPSELRMAHAQPSGLRLLAAGTRSGSSKTMEAAQARLTYADDHDPVRTDHTQLLEFQRDCG